MLAPLHPPRRPRRLRLRSTAVERAVVRSFLALPSAVLRRVLGAPLRSPEGFTVDAQLQGLLALLRIAKQKPVSAGNLDRARRALDRTMPMLDLSDVPGVVVVERMVGGAAGDLRARVYTPVPSPPMGLGKKPLPMPALVYFHGGGFVMGSLDSHDGVCRGLARRAQVTVVSVDYRLAPENPFPAPVDDALAATRWVLEHAGGLGIDPHAVAVGGDSAGGNVAAAVAQAMRRDARRPTFQLLVYPTTDCTRSHPSHRLFARGYLLEGDAMEWCVNAYVPDAAQRTDPRASPLFGDAAGLPPALVITAGFDPLRDEGDAYAAKMSAAGVTVEHVRRTEMIHGFFSMAGAVREADTVFRLAARSLRKALTAASRAAAQSRPPPNGSA